MRRPVLTFALLFALPTQAAALVGGAPDVPKPKTQPEVMFVGTRGNFCTGTAIARDLVLTAAHCVLPGADYKLLEFGADKKPVLKDTVFFSRHPQFNLKSMLAHRATADVGLIKLSAPLSVTPAPLMPARPRVAVGERFVVRGYGAAERGNEESLATLRAATLVAAGQPSSLQLRLVDPATEGKRAGLGACTGDSGAPIYQETPAGLAILGLVSWSTGANAEAGCGGLTGVTPLELYRAWILETAKMMGSAIGP